MSDAIRASFFQAVRSLPVITKSVIVTDEMIVQFYGFCGVHFLRSRSKVGRNRKVVDLEDMSVFYSMLSNMIKFKAGQFSFFHAEATAFMEKFPKTKRWFQWYLHPKRAPILFHACRSLEDHNTKRQVRLSGDTNAQENVGRQIQYISKHNKVGVGPAIELCWRFCNSDQVDRNNVLSGMSAIPSRQRSAEKRRRRRTKTNDSMPMPKLAGSTKKVRGRRRRYKNDGRPSDTTDELLDRIIPYTLNGFAGIPWNFTMRNGLRIRNTCRLDSILVPLFFIEHSEYEQQSKHRKGGDMCVQ